jgi:DNA-directed RNA polymerase I, II, and III subunit RPABC5
MLIPVRCMSCGKLLADKWVWYQEQLRAAKPGSPHPDRPTVFDGHALPKTPEAALLDKLGLTRYCCRRDMLTSATLIEKI